MIMKKFRLPALLLPALWLCLAGTAGAQYNTASFDHLSVEEGLSQSEIMSIRQDQKGFIWFGTVDGLNKYDGYNFQHFKHDPFDSTSLSNNEVVALCEDRTGNLWVGTAHGLNRLDPATGSFIRYNQLVSAESGGEETGDEQYVNTILEDTWGSLWVGTWGGLKRLIPVKTSDGKIRYRIRHYLPDPANLQTITHNAVLSLYQDGAGEIWVGTRNGLNRIRIINPRMPAEGQRVLFENARNSKSPVYRLPNPVVRRITGDSFGTLWLGTNKGLTRIHPRKETVQDIACQHHKPNPNTDDVVMDLLMDGQHNLWIASQTNGLCRFTIEDEASVARMVHYKEEPFSGKGMRSSLIYSLYESKDPGEDIVWIGTRGAGVHKYSRTKNSFTLWSRLTNLDKSSGLNSTFAIGTDRHNLLWIGTVKGLLSINRNDLTVKHYQHHPNDSGSLSNDFVCSVYEDRRGNLWIGSVDGLNLFDRKKGRFRRYHFAEGIRKKSGENNVKVMYEDSHGVFWVGTMYDLKKFDPVTGHTESYRHKAGDPNSLHEYYVTSIQEDKAGNLWVGTRYGLNRFDRKTGRFTHFRHEYNNRKSLISSAVWNMLRDSKGNLWICTDKGMNTMVLSAGGEPEFMHYTEKNGLSNNFIYGATEDAQGFIWMSTNLGLSRLDPGTGQVKNYDAGDGLPSNEFNEGAFHRSADGELFFGGNSGVVSFRPAAMRRNGHLPGVALSSFKIFERPLNIDSLTAAAGEIRLRYWENFFSFEFVALDYTNPRKNQYAYQLEGINDDWVYSGNRHYANFTNVPPGNYTFRVKGSNSDGVWNENAIASIRIAIHPPFWKTWWFYIAVAVLLAVVASLLHEYRVKANVTRLMELERVKLAENERVRKLAAEDLHDEFGNRLTRISLLTDLIKARLNGHGAEVEDLLNKIRDNSSQLYQGTKDFIWSLNPHNDSVFEVAVRLKDFGDDVFDKTSVVFLTDGITDELRTAMLPMGQSRHLILVFKEAMSNVLKHSEAKCVSLRFELTSGQLKTSLTDDGRGFGTDREGAGNGLMNMQSRARKLSGSLKVSSEPGGGAEVSLTLPVNYLTPASLLN